MSTQSTSVDGSEAPPGAEPKAIQPATHHRSTVKWGELVGFRRRETTQSSDGTTPAESTSVGCVVVGKGASIVGEITNCSQVEIAGALEGKVVAEAVIVRAGGCLKGRVCSERAEVHGTIEGQVQVEDHLDIRSTGDVSGELAYGKLSVASGGRLSGSIEIVSDAHHREEPAAQPQPAPFSAPVAAAADEQSAG